MLGAGPVCNCFEGFTAFGPVGMLLCRHIDRTKSTSGDGPSTVGKLARNASNAGGVAFKKSLGELGVPTATGATLEPVNVLEAAGIPGPDGPDFCLGS